MSCSPRLRSVMLPQTFRAHGASEPTRIKARAKRKRKKDTKPRMNFGRFSFEHSSQSASPSSPPKSLLPPSHPPPSKPPPPKSKLPPPYPIAFTRTVTQPKKRDRENAQLEFWGDGQSSACWQMLIVKTHCSVREPECKSRPVRTLFSSIPETLLQKSCESRIRQWIPSTPSFSRSEPKNHKSWNQGTE